MESLGRKIMSSNRTWSDYPDAPVHAKCFNALPREYNFQKHLLKSREGGGSRKAIVMVTRDRYQSPGLKPFRKVESRPS